MKIRAIEKEKGSPLLKENYSYAGWIAGIILVDFLIEVSITLWKGSSFERLFGMNYLMWFLTLLVVPFGTINTIYLFKVWAKRYSFSQIQLILIKTAGLLIGVLVFSLLMEYLSLAVGVEDDDYITLGGYQFSTVSTNVITNGFFALLIGLPVFFLQGHKAESKRELQKKQMELDKLEQLKTQSELEALQAKINPHFLYNSLNSIVSLIHENPDKAEQMVLSLSDLFRYSVNSKGAHLATIEEELKMVTTYLDIELVRFEDQLQFHLQVDDEAKACLVPKFFIQPLIENAIKHGTSKISDGVIQLNIAKKGEELHLHLYDNGPAFPQDLNAGYGLKSTVDKLNLFYGSDYIFQLEHAPEKHIRIELRKMLNHA